MTAPRKSTKSTKSPDKTEPAEKTEPGNTRAAANRALPPRWRQRGKTYYYRVPPGQEEHWDGRQEFRLGTSLYDAHQVFQSRVHGQARHSRSDREALYQTIVTMGDLIDQYKIEHLPTLAQVTQRTYLKCLGNLRAVFAEVPVSDIHIGDVRHYYEKRSEKRYDAVKKRAVGGQKQAHQEYRVLRHVFTMAVQWRVIDHHPFMQILKLSSGPDRDRYLENWEIREMLSIRGHRRRGSYRMMKAAIVLKLLTSLGQGDLLRLTTKNLRKGGIHYTRRKTVKHPRSHPTIISWTPDLKEAIRMVLDARTVRLEVSREQWPNEPEWLFCNKFGKGYFNEHGVPEGWNSIWSRYVARVYKETRITVPFKPHDIRAKTGSDVGDIFKAQKLLSHADVRTTQRFYDRNAVRVDPLDLDLSDPDKGDDEPLEF